MSDLIPLGALWKHEKNDGTIYFSGVLGDARVYVFPNTKKEKDNQPDYRLVVGPKKKKEDNATNEQPVQGAVVGGDDIPF